MSSEALATVTKMMESLPESRQEQVVRYLRDYIAEVWDEAEWDAQFERTQDRLVEAAQQARAAIAAGHAERLDTARPSVVVLQPA